MQSKLLPAVPVDSLTIISQCCCVLGDLLGDRPSNGSWVLVWLD